MTKKCLEWKDKHFFCALQLVGTVLSLIEDKQSMFKAEQEQSELSYRKRNI